MLFMWPLYITIPAHLLIGFLSSLVLAVPYYRKKKEIKLDDALLLFAGIMGGLITFFFVIFYHLDKNKHKTVISWK